MYKYYYTITELDHISNDVRTYEGTAIARSHSELIDALYDTTKAIISSRTEKLCEVFGEPNNKAIILKKERI
jgi:hypothetical protein